MLIIEFLRTGLDTPPGLKGQGPKVGLALNTVYT